MNEQLRRLLQAYRERRAVDGTLGAFNAQALEQLDGEIAEMEKALGFTPIDAQSVIDRMEQPLGSGKNREHD